MAGLAAHETREAARGSPPTPIRTASGRPHGGYQHLRLAARLMRRRAHSCDHLARRKLHPRVGPLLPPKWPHTRREQPRADRRRGSPRPPPGALPAAIGICGARHARCAAARPAATSWQAGGLVGASAHGRICHAAAEARAAARRSAPRLTTAAAGGAPGGYRHLRRAARPMRRGTPRCDLVASRRPRWRVRPWPHLPRRSRGASSRAQIGAAAHHGRRRGRSRRLSASASRGTPDAPRHTPLRPHGEV